MTLGMNHDPSTREDAKMTKERWNNNLLPITLESNIRKTIDHQSLTRNLDKSEVDCPIKSSSFKGVIPRLNVKLFHPVPFGVSLKRLELRNA
ncbi:hypothetical protein V6N13_059274 [Hibiscus sabdariffa]|uniref:Uncharacterized protein n=1 Tax=Hibiscus sabdariffa TaxID=183260 RepID=A0ABR2GDV7_9ROSI